jgi:hypothetical protein
VETIARIRREHFVKGKTIKEIARDLGVSRNTVRKVLRSGETSFEYERTDDRISCHCLCMKVSAGSASSDFSGSRCLYFCSPGHAARQPAPATSLRLPQEPKLPSFNHVVDPCPPSC